MEFKDLVSHYHKSYISEEGIALWKINSEIRKGDNMPEIDIHSILFVIDGQVEIGTQDGTYLLTRGCFADVFGGKHSVKLLSASPDIQAYLLLLTEDYISGLIKNKPPFPLSYAMDLMQNPVYAVDKNYIAPIIRCLDDIEQAMSHPLHYFQEAMLKCKIWVLFLQMAEILQQKAQEEGIGQKKNVIRAIHEAAFRTYKKRAYGKFLRVQTKYHAAIFKARGKRMFGKKCLYVDQQGACKGDRQPADEHGYDHTEHRG